MSLSVQWGYAQKPTSEYDFDWVYPIPFPTLVGAIMLTPQYEGQCRPHSINSFDRFSCSLRTDGTKPELNSNHVFAIGFQQWGNSWVTHDKGWVNFPIKFNKICFTCIPIYTDYGDSPTYTSAVALSKKDVTGFNFRTAANKITLSYIAIGMQLQWGTIYNAKAGALDNNNNNNAVTFPMPFTTVFALSPTFIIKANHVNVDVIVNLYSLSNTGAVIRCWDYDNATNDGQLTYVALGKQQWGVGVSSASGTTTLTYHLAYSNFAAVFTGNTSGDKSTSPVNMTNVGLSSCRIHVKDDARYYADSFNWFAIGYQQWGKHARTTDYEQITFPISFTNVNYTCISTSYDLNSNADVTAAYSGTYNSGKYPEEQERTVSRFYVKTGSNAGGRDWIAIGQQQWGMENKTNLETFTFPVSFTTVYACFIQDHWSNHVNSYTPEIYALSNSSVTFSHRGNVANYILALGI